MNYPCRDCKRRTPGCHDVCAEYKEAHEKDRKIRKELYMERLIDYTSADTYKELTGKYNRKRQKD